ncbi:MAG: cation-translocating P-type ATPase, partial [Lachnospiraceae bacterium]|nr:cation-translocating P-type ATPase [Lachnospiraceae bacterium]
ITGIPLLYLAIWRIIYNPGISKISSALLICIGMASCIGMTFLTGHDELFAAGEIGFIMSLGAILEDKTTEHARSGLKKLISLNPDQSRRVQDGKEQMVPIEEVRPGDIIRVNPGEIIPVDGIIAQGNSSVDQSIMTGESLPVDKEAGDQVFCGTMNQFGSVDIRASRVGKDSSLEKLIGLVEEADKQKAPIARIADQAASWLVPLALLIAILAYIITGDLEKGVTILVVFCPCALILATPTAVMAGIGQATKHGVIVKSGEALEKMGRVDTIAFDKTGTLTEGRLSVSDLLLFPDNFDGNNGTAASEVPISRDFSDTGISPEKGPGGNGQNGFFQIKVENSQTLLPENLGVPQLVSLAAATEKRSEHPLGKAICQYAQDKGLTIPDAKFFRMESGKGVEARISGEAEGSDLFLLCGNEKFLSEKGVAISSQVSEALTRLREEGKASVIVSLNGHIIGIIALSDILRQDAGTIVKRLHDMDVKTLLLTGDSRQAASYFAEKTGIGDMRPELLPEEKVRSIRELQEAGAHVCMIGDGVNDAPALKTADIGLAMGGMGSDIAADAADVVLMKDDISKVPYLKRLSNETVKTIKLSITLSLIINTLAITFSLLGILNPTTGALWHNVGSCFVVLLAASLYDRKLE